MTRSFSENCYSMAYLGDARAYVNIGVTKSPAKK